MENPEQIGPAIIIVSSIVIITLSVFTMLFFIVFLNKKRKLLLEKEMLRASYEKTILQSQLEIQEHTFNTISQEIHDNVGQILSLAKVQLNIIDESETTDRALLADAKDNISKAMNDLRDIARGMNSDRILALGLTKSVEQEAQRINRTGIVNIRVRIPGSAQKPDSKRDLIAYRVIQECLQNIIKHAAASSVTIDFTYSPGITLIVITDNGKGFNFNQERLAMGGLGLQNIFKRIDLIGGKVSIDSIIKQGTTVKITIPHVQH